MVARHRPGPQDIRVIVGDTHGDHVNMLGVLRKAGAIDERGVRQPGYWLCHVGDVIHAGHGVQAADEVCLGLALSLFDCLVLGNHETPFMYGVSRFAGQNEHLHCQSMLNQSAYEGRWVAATAVDRFLVCHGGLHGRMLDERAFKAQRRRGELDDPAALADAIEVAWERRIRRRQPEPLFDWVGVRRGGQRVYGSIFWTDWRELMEAQRKWPSPVGQIVGHTPGRNVRSKFNGRFWCVDVGATLSGYAAAIMRKPGETTWTKLKAGDGRQVPGIGL